jgi:hypothetical protein
MSTTKPALSLSEALAEWNAAGDKLRLRVACYALFPGTVGEVVQKNFWRHAADYAVYTLQWSDVHTTAVERRLLGEASAFKRHALPPLGGAAVPSLWGLAAKNTTRLTLIGAKTGILVRALRQCAPSDQERHFMRDSRVTDTPDTLNAPNTGA